MASVTLSSLISFSTSFKQSSFSSSQIKKLSPLSNTQSLKFPTTTHPNSFSIQTPITKAITTKSFSTKKNDEQIITAEVSESSSPKPTESKVQVLHVYELNEGDRGSPVYLRLSNKAVNTLGDLVTFSNKLYSGTLEKRLGITAGLCVLIQHNEEKKGDRYEAIFSFYFGDYGHISVRGAYLTYEPTYVAVTGGSGIFEGVSGKVYMQQLVFNPVKILYTFYLQGIKDLPEELLGAPVEPTPSVEATPAAKACEAGATIANFTI